MNGVNRALVASPRGVDDVWKKLSFVDKAGSPINGFGGPVLSTRILNFDFPPPGTPGPTTEVNPNPPPPFRAKVLFSPPQTVTPLPNGWEAASVCVTSWQAHFTSVQNPPANLLEAAVLAFFEDPVPKPPTALDVCAGAQLVDWCWPSEIKAYVRAQVTFFGKASAAAPPIAISPQVFSAADPIVTAQVPLYLVQGPKSALLRSAQASIVTAPGAAEVIAVTLTKVVGGGAAAISTVAFAAPAAIVQPIPVPATGIDLPAGTILRADIIAPAGTAARGLGLTLVLEDVT